MKGTIIATGARAWTAAAAFLVVAASMTASVFADSSTPSPVPDSAPAGRFSAVRAMDVLNEIAAETRPIGSAAGDQARDLLARKLSDAGLDVETGADIGAFGYDSAAQFGRVDNLVATLPGKDSTGRVLLVSHYDSVAAGPGASDAASQVAAILETVRAVTSQGPPRNDLVVVLTDGEEEGLLGAEAYTRQHPAGDNDVVLNWEARGTRGPSVMFETSTGNSELIEIFGESADTRGDSSTVEAYRLMPNNTDFTRFSQAGYAGLNSAHVEGAAWYHTPGDTIAALDPGTMQHHGDNMLGLTSRLTDMDLSGVDSDTDAVYFHLFSVMISYSGTLVWPLAVAAAGIWLAAVWLARRRRAASLPRTCAAAASVVLPLGVAAGLGFALWPMLTALRPAYADTNSILYRPWPFELAIIAMAIAAVLAWYFGLRNRLGSAALALGGLAWPVLLGFGCAAMAPGTSFLVTVPALLGGCGAVAALWPRGGSTSDGRAARIGIAAVTVTAIPGGVLLVGAAMGFFTTFGLATAGLSAAVVAMFAVLLVPLLEPVQGNGVPVRYRTRIGTGCVAVLIVAALTATGLFADGYDRDHPRRSALAYVVDADSGVATWISTDTAPSQWTRRFVSEPSADADALPPGFADADSLAQAWTGPAEAGEVTAPQAGVEATGTTLVVNARSLRGAPCLRLVIDAPITQVTASVEGRAPSRVAVAQGTGPWPTSIGFADAPAEGVEFTVTLATASRPDIMVFDESSGLDDVPGYTPRPDGEIRSSFRSSDLVTVGRAVEY